MHYLDSFGIHGLTRFGFGRIRTFSFGRGPRLQCRKYLERCSGRLKWDNTAEVVGQKASALRLV